MKANIFISITQCNFIVHITRQERENGNSAWWPKIILLKATEYISNNLISSKSEIIKDFMGLQFNNRSGEATITWQKEYLHYILESISKIKATLNTGTKQYRFSIHVISTSLSLYLYNRQSYDKLRNSGLLSLTDPRHLKRIGEGLKVVEDGNPMIYSIFQEEV